MKTRTQLFLVIALTGGLTAGGVVHTTSFPRSGVPGSRVAPTPELEALAAALEDHVRFQTIEIGRRQAARDGTSQALVEYIAINCDAAGLESKEIEYRADQRQHFNVIAEKEGRQPEILLVGCHYDGYGHSPSADASASGCAALLEIMKLVADVPTDKTIRFAFFSTGEPPYRGTEEMGSRIYAAACRETKDPIKDVLILDSVGFYSSEPKSQGFYFPWSFVYPKTADFVCVVGGLGQRDLVTRTMRAFAAANELPARGGALPGWIARFRSGDQDAFLAEGFDAVLLTDTGVNRFPDIRTQYDTFDRLNYLGFARAVEGMANAVLELAGR